MASIVVQPFYEEPRVKDFITTSAESIFVCCHMAVTATDLRLNEDSTKEKFQELPLCLIKEKYEKLPGGKKFVEDIMSSGALSTCNCLSGV